MQDFKRGHACGWLRRRWESASEGERQGESDRETEGKRERGRTTNLSTKNRALQYPPLSLAFSLSHILHRIHHPRHSTHHTQDAVALPATANNIGRTSPSAHPFHHFVPKPTLPHRAPRDARQTRDTTPKKTRNRYIENARKASTSSTGVVDSSRHLASRISHLPTPGSCAAGAVA